MTQPADPKTITKLRKLAQVAAELPESRWAVSITRLTSLKSLCAEPAAAHHFATYLAEKTLGRVQRGQGRAEHLDKPTQQRHRAMMTEALPEMEAWMQEPTAERREQLWKLLARMRDEQNEHEHIQWGAVRIIHNQDLLLFEYALHTLLCSQYELGYWGYQTARHYTERYDPRHGTGLIPESAPLLDDIVNFWTTYLNLDLSAASQTVRKKTGKRPATTQGSSVNDEAPTMHAFTHRQGQFLAFIHLYRRLHRLAPAEMDLVKFFRVTPPSVHGMIVKLTELGLITREPGVDRSIRVLLPEDQIPRLEPTEGPPW